MSSPRVHRRSIVELFAEQAARTPEAIALESDEARWSYAELDQRAERLAQQLARRGVGPETLVALSVEPSPELVLGLLAIWKAGGACLPLDPRWPAARRDFVLRDAAPQAILDGNFPWNEIAVGDRPARAPTAEQLAYVIYTSGSTGRPKGVEVEHGSLANLHHAQRELLALTPRDRVLQFASLGFDAALAEVVMALGAGATLCLSPRDALAGPSLFDLIARRRISCVTLPPSLLAASPARELPELRHLFVAGESCAQAVVDRWATGRIFRNLYGPTEATVWTTAALCRPGAPPSIGTPISNVSVALLDGDLRPVPDGSDGELCIGGAGVARGYRNDPAETARRFVAAPTGRIFRSGDRARRRDDGTLEWRGRLDRQVKVRGVRVELDEIEAALVERARATEAAVELRTDAQGDPHLVAWVVANVGPRELRTRLGAWLPEAMQPSRYRMLDALPRNPSGKIDRAALPAPDERSDERDHRPPYLAPRTDGESWLCAAFSQMLAVARVGVRDDFFALGGHSLTAARLVARLRAARGVELAVARIFESPTVEALARDLDAAIASRLPPLVPLAGEVEAPPSFAQERLAFVDAIEPNLAIYNAPLLARFSGPGAGDTAIWRNALDELVRRHDPLRTTFARSDGRLRAMVAEPKPLAIPIVDLRALPLDERERELARRSVEEARRPFDLATGPLLRATLLRTADDETALLLNLHHTITDGWSTGVLLDELLALREAFAAGRPSPLPALAIRYGDFAAWERNIVDGPVGEQLLAHWRARLSGMAPLALPNDRSPPARRRHPAVRQPLRIAPSTVAALVDLGRAERCTPFMVLLATLQALLARWSGQDDVAVGTPVANRARAELEPLVGCFVNTLVLRTRLDGAPTFRALLARVRETALDAYAHAALPFDRLVAALNPDRALAAPLVRALLVLENAPAPPQRRGEVRVTVEPLDNGAAMFDLTLALREQDGALAGSIELDGDRFDPATAARIADQFSRLLDGALADPDRPVAELPLLSVAERARRYASSSGPTLPLLADRCVHLQFAEHAARTPEAPALITDGETWSYAQLADRSHQLAHHLIALGARDRPVALLLDRSPDLVAAVLAVLHSGNACMPLDPSHPAERLAFMLAEARPSLCVTDRRHRGALPTGETIALDLDDDAAAIAQRPTGAPAATTTLDDLAYLLYTSGSTGRPKGVAMPHRALANLVGWQLATHPPATRTLQLAPLTFDVSFQEIFTTLCAGGALVLAGPCAARDPSEIARLVAAHAVERLFLPTALAAALAERLADDPAPLASLREVFVAGEALRVTGDLTRLFAALPRCALYNHYGPTETHVVTEQRLPADPRAWPLLPPIGAPIANARVLLVDAAGEPVADGAIGELLVGGVPLARGYLDAALTAERFVVDPLGAPGERLYRTGDLGRRLPDGTIELHGRADDQVKIRGFRVEPGEIEAVLSLHSQVKAARAIVREGRLTAYVVPAAGTPPTAIELLAYAARALPEPMLPAAIVLIDALPLTANGKVDRAALPDPPPRESIGHSPPRTETERRIAEIWREVLRVPRVGADDDFFALGGHSLLVMQVVSRIARAFSVKLLPRDLFDRPTPSLLAERVDRALRELAHPPREAP